jgi:PAS domain S-box-containing protein
VQTVRAHSGEAALKQLLQKEFAAILLDVDMPVMDGFETARLIRGHPRFEKTPIIFVTGVRVSDLDQLKGYEVGAIDYLSVPVVPEILRAKVAVLVELYQRRSQLQELNQSLGSARAELAARLQEAREENAEQLRAIFEHPAEATVVLRSQRGPSEDGRDWVYCNANVNAITLLKTTRSRLIGSRVSDVLPDQAERIAGLCARVLRTGEHIRYEAAVGGQDLLVTLFRVGRELVVGSGVDISDRKRMEAALRASEDRFRLAAEAVQGLVYECDMASGKVTRSKGLASLLGFSPEEVPPTLEWWNSRVHPDDRATLDERLSPPTVANGDRCDIEFRIRHRDGRWVWVRDHFTVERAPDGTPIRVIGNVVDVTDQRRSREALKADAQRFREITETIPQLVWSARADGFLDYYNGRFLEYLGYTLEEMQGETWVKTLHPNDAPIAREAWDRAVASGREYSADFRIRQHRTGSYRWHAVRGTPLRAPDGTILRWFGTCTDIHDRKQAAEALRESERRYRTLIDYAPVGVVHSAMSGQIEFANAAFCNLLGYTAEELRAKTWQEITHPEDVAEDRRRGQQVVSGQLSHYTLEKRYLRKDGTPVWALLYGNFVRDDTGQAIEGVAVVLDITERRQSDSALRDSQERLLLSQRAAGLGTFDWELRSGSLSWDECLREVWGLGPNDPVNIDVFFSGLHPDDRESTRKSMEHALDPLSDGHYFASYRVINRQDSRTRWIDATGRAYFSDGQAVRLVGVIQDVTDKRMAEDKSREQEARFRDLANNIDQFAWTCDELGLATWYNDRWYAYTGTTFEEMRGDGWQRVHDPAHLPRVTAHLKDCLSSGSPWEDTFPIRGKDGQYRWFLSRAVPIRDAEGRVTSWFGTNTDVTDLRRLQEALRDSSRLKDEFLAMLAHELRNPLAPIQNATEMLLKQVPAADWQRPFLEMIQRQGTHLSRLVDDLLDVARITQGRIAVRRELVPVPMCVEMARETIEPLIREKRQRLTVTHAPEPLFVLGDRIRLAQSIASLMHNAAKYSPDQSEIRVALSVENEEVLIEVADDGIGMDPEFVPKAFELFVQSERALDRSQGGLGIGLAVCKRLTEMHGGTVQGRSDGLSRGSTFTIRLPRAVAADRSDSPGQQLQLLPRRVLIVDDNRDAADSLSALLNLQGHRTRCAYSGRDGLRLFSEFAPEVVLLDIGLPELNGYEVAREIRAGGSSVVIIALSGYGQPEDRQRSVEAGIDSHLVKPVDIAAIENALRYHLPT